MKMKVTSPFLAGILMSAALVSCSPQMFNMPIDMRHASVSGLDLGGKSFSLVYVDNGFKADSCLSKGLAEGFAASLEKEYFGGETCIDIFRLKEQEGADYSNKDTLINMVMESGRDVVFLLDAVEFKKVDISEAVRSGLPSPDSAMKATAFIHIGQDIYVYDSMYAKDTVIKRQCEETLVQQILLPENFSNHELKKRLALSLEPEGIKAGQKMTKAFHSTWRTEEYGIIYYDEDAWLAAAESAVNFQWKEAMDQWMELLDTKNMEKRSCASYNIALSCYMLGNYPLALEWLNSSDRDCPIDLNRILRKRIQARM